MKNTGGGHKITDRCCKEAHLHQCIEPHGGNHASGKRVSNGVEQLYEQGMYPGMMIAVWDKSKHLFQLIDAVRCHDSRELVQIIRKPAKHAQ